MHISSHILRLALLRIFADAGSRAGDCLSFAAITKGWADTGLRESDLRAAVRDLVESGDLVRAERDGTPGLALSAGGYHAVSQPDGELQGASIADDTTLFEVRYRARGGADPGLRRRANDQPK
jgi:hypothetical protein